MKESGNGMYHYDGTKAHTHTFGQEDDNTRRATSRKAGTLRWKHHLAGRRVGRAIGTLDRLDMLDCKTGRERAVYATSTV